jgi:hypothetical protein
VQGKSGAQAEHTYSVFPLMVYSTQCGAFSSVQSSGPFGQLTGATSKPPTPGVTTGSVGTDVGEAVGDDVGRLVVGFCDILH